MRLRMPRFAHRPSDEEVADLASFVRSAWSNNAGGVTAEMVADQRREDVGKTSRRDEANDRQCHQAPTGAVVSPHDHYPSVRGEETFLAAGALEREGTRVH